VNAQKQLSVYNKEIINLKRMIEMGSSKIAEAENKLKHSLAMTDVLLKKIKDLKREQNNQGKELEKIIITQGYEGEIKFLNESVKQLKTRAKELEDKLIIVRNNNIKTKDYFENVKQKYTELRSKQSTSYTQEEYLLIEIKDNSKLKDEHNELKALLEKQRHDNKRDKEMARLEIENLRKKAKKLELINRVSAVKLKELAKVRKEVCSIKKAIVTTKCRIEHREKFSLLRSHRDHNNLPVILRRVL